MGSKKLHRVVVLGAGFGGIRVARKLARYATSRHLSVTLVNRASTHAYTPAFYALAGTTSDSARHRHLERAAALPLRRLCKGLPITILEAEVAAIDTGAKKVTLGDGRS
jgi:NADH dehydrogenase FAD-containing subunit